MDDLWVMKSKDVGLIVCTISFQDFQPICGPDPPTSQTDGQTICNRKTALCTIVHHAVKINNLPNTAECTLKQVKLVRNKYKMRRY